MRLKTLSLALASSCLFYTVANASGLGKLTVLSALGQPLRAEIELTSVPKDDVGNVVPKLAGAEAYKQANIIYSSNLNSLQFSIEERGSRRFVLITSTQSVNEPFLEVLVELNSNSGKLIREYTILLDPAEMQTANTPMSSSNGITISSQLKVTSTPLAPVQSRAAAAASAKPVANPPASANDTSSVGSATYQVKNGDTLSKIARQYKPQGVSLEQMLVTLQHDNSSAFIDNNMNLLRSGHILTIPDATEINRISQGEAKKIVLAQSNDFNTYRNKFASQIEQAKPEKEATSKKANGGKITAKVTEAPTPVNEAKDKLKLSKAQLQDQADKKAAEEDRIAKQQALDTANARLKELEANTAKLQSILDLENKAASASAAKATPPVPAPVASAAAVAAPAVIPEPGLFDNLMKYLPYGAGVLVVLGLIGLLVGKRKKKSGQFDDESILTGADIKANSLVGSTGGQSVDTNNSVFNSNFAPSADQLDANEVDPVAEADVYIAYGRDEQAEEILKEALRTQPDRQAVRVKLLEIYAHRKDTHTFETIAGELYGMTGGEGPDWAQVASLGLIIDSQNPLYAGGQAAGDAGVLKASALSAQNLDPEALLSNSLSQEISDSISAENEPANPMVMGDVNEHARRISDIEDGLDFDLGLSANSNQNSTFGSASIASAEKEEAQADETLMQDPDHEIQIPGHSEFDAAAEEPVVTHNEVAAKLSANEESREMDFTGLDFDFPVPKSDAGEPGRTQDHDELTSPDTTHIETPKPSGSLDYDLSDIDFDLPKSDAAKPSVSPADSAAGDNGSDFASKVTEIESSAEMATKLDLAVAYLEIGDKDGARELLEEVLKGGNQEQVMRAKTMLHELA